MKKSLIVIVAAVYFVAIVLVAFLGFVAEANSSVIYTDEIQLVFTKEAGYSSITDKGANYTYNGGVVYSVKYNKEYDPEYGYEPEETDVEKKYKYVYTFQPGAFQSMFYSKVGAIQLNAKPITYEEGKEVTNPKISYFIPSNHSSFAEVDELGKITFKKNVDVYIFDLTMKAEDGGSANTTTRVQFVIM